MRTNLKLSMHRLMRQPAINGILKTGLKPLSSVLPRGALSRVPVVGKVKIALQSGDILFLDSDGFDSIVARLYWHGLQGFEPESLDIFQQLVKQGGAMIDVGANVGLYALIAAISDNTRPVYAFEPVPVVFAHLQRNVAINNLHNIEPYQMAVTNYTGEITLYVPRSEFHLPVSASTAKDFQPETSALVIQGITLDSFIEEHNISPVGLLKIDTEATEHLVLEGARTLLKHQRPVILCEVLAGETHEALEAQLLEHGYRFYQITPGGLVHCQTLSGGETIHDRNYLFLPEERADDIMQTLARSERKPISS